MILFFIAFVGGMLTVLAPCILPLLPVVLGGSLTDAKVNLRKATTVILSLGASVLLFTVVLKISTIFINIPPVVWQYISGGVLIVFGFVTIFPSLWDRLPFASLLNRNSQKVLGSGYTRHSFYGDVIVGAALGPVFTTCSPTYFIVLATVLPQNPFIGILDLLAYIVGLCSALFLITFLGQKIIARLDVAANPHGTFKKVIGILFVVIGVVVFSGYDKVIETALTNANYFDVTKIEQNLLLRSAQREVSDAISSIATTSPKDAKGTTGTNISTALRAKMLAYHLAPEITNPAGYINTDNLPITFKEFRGKKVVLVDFWTYSCINCQRTLPYLEKWYTDYKDKGLEIISIHTPEFAFEKVRSNVADAANRLGVRYPIVLDNEYGTWNAFGNSFWPRKYLIDIDGYVVYDHIGEGGYDDTEKAIQAALNERADRMGTKHIDPNSVTDAPVGPMDVLTSTPSSVASPEIYFGYRRNEGYPSLSLQGNWQTTSEYARNTAAADISYTYTAKNVYMVLSSDLPDGVDIKITRDGKPLKQIAGADVDSTSGIAHIKGERLYKLIQGESYGTHSIEIHIPQAGLKAFTFTFG